MLELKLIHVSKRGPIALQTQIINIFWQHYKDQFPVVYKVNRSEESYKIYFLYFFVSRHWVDVCILYVSSMKTEELQNSKLFSVSRSWARARL